MIYIYIYIYIYTVGHRLRESFFSFLRLDGKNCGPWPAIRTLVDQTQPKPGTPESPGGDVEMELIGGAYIWSLMKKEPVGISHDVSLHKRNSLQITHRSYLSRLYLGE